MDGIDGTQMLIIESRKLVGLMDGCIYSSDESMEREHVVLVVMAVTVLIVGCIVFL
jgi:hypothetical protein